MDYSDYRNFRNVGRKAFEAYLNSKIDPAEHVVETTDMIIAGKGAAKEAVVRTGKAHAISQELLVKSGIFKTR